jgi:hypothetical protein
MKTGFVFLVAGALALNAQAAGEKAGTKATPPRSGKMVFNLFPKSFQKNPELDFNVFTEITPSGKTVTPPTAEQPAYYVAHVSPPESRGLTGGGVTKNAPTVEQIERFAAKALRVNHYLPHAEGLPAPKYVMMIHWGSYSNPAFSGEDYAADDGASGASAQELMHRVLGDVVKRKAVIDRARLIGGEKFAIELNDVLNQEVQLLRASAGTDSARAAAAEGGGLLGDASSMGSFMQAMGPFSRYMAKDERTAEMVEEVFSDSYYVAISALDYATVAAKKPVLLWRSKLTVNSIGVAMHEAVPPLIAAGADYLGKQTDTAVVLSKKIMRGGRVDIGEATVQEYIDPDKTEPAKPAPKGEEPTKK